ncbi:DUF6624 domain-containing protein [Luedemannella helvata]
MSHEELAAELIARMERDQEVRARIGAGPITDEVAERMRAVDDENTRWLTAVLDRHGWPRRSQVGEHAAHAASLLAQHADDHPEVQRRCLGLLEEAVRDREADPAYLAYLTDRVLRADGKPQLYGTQFWREPGGGGQLTPQPIADPANLDERRRSVGLPPFAEYERQMRLL